MRGGVGRGGGEWVRRGGRNLRGEVFGRGRVVLYEVVEGQSLGGKGWW